MSGPLVFSTLATVTAGLPNAARRTQADDGQLSWQSAFWALVSIAVGAAAQPSGSILGLPPRWGFALKCSPVLCLANALEALLCIPRPWRPRPDPTAMCRKYALQPADSETELPAPVENNGAIRLVSFALGPVMSATKLFACSGLVYTKIVAGCYLVSFVCDEAVLNLAWLSGRGTASPTAPSLLATAFSFMPSSNEEPTAAPTAPPLPLAQQAAAMLSIPPTQDKPGLKDLADLAVLASTAFVAYLVSGLVFVVCFLEPNLLAWVHVLATLVGIVIYALIAVVKKYRREGLALTLIWEFLVRWCLGGFAMGLVFRVLENGATVVSRAPSGALTLYPQGIPSFLAFAGHVDLVGLLVVGALRIAHALLGTYRIAFLGGVIPGTDCGTSRGSQARLQGLAVGWCLLHFVVALLMYYLMFDPDQTTKPAWTEVLG